MTEARAQEFHERDRRTGGVNMTAPSTSAAPCPAWSTPWYAAQGQSTIARVGRGRETPMWESPELLSIV